MSEILQVAMAGLVAAGYLVLWRLDAMGRARERIDQAHRRNVAENKRTVTKLKQAQVNWEALNQRRYELNERYSETIERMRKHHGIRDAGAGE